MCNSTRCQTAQGCLAWSQFHSVSVLEYQGIARLKAGTAWALLMSFKSSRNSVLACRPAENWHSCTKTDWIRLHARQAWAIWHLIKLHNVKQCFFHKDNNFHRQAQHAAACVEHLPPDLLGYSCDLGPCTVKTWARSPVQKLGLFAGRLGNTLGDWDLGEECCPRSLQYCTWSSALHSIVTGRP